LSPYRPLVLPNMITRTTDPLSACQCSVVISQIEVLPAVVYTRGSFSNNLHQSFLESERQHNPMPTKYLCSSLLPPSRRNSSNPQHLCTYRSPFYGGLTWGFFFPVECSTFFRKRYFRRLTHRWKHDGSNEQTLRRPLRQGFSIERYFLFCWELLFSRRDDAFDSAGFFHLPFSPERPPLAFGAIGSKSSTNSPFPDAVKPGLL